VLQADMVSRVLAYQGHQAESAGKGKESRKIPKKGRKTPLQQSFKRASNSEEGQEPVFFEASSEEIRGGRESDKRRGSAKSGR